MQTDQMVNVAVVGCGLLAQRRHLPNVLKNPRLNLKWCCEINEELLDEVGREYGPEGTTTDAQVVADDPDCSVVIICTHHNVRKELITLFAQAGKHIYAEKPLASDLAETQEIYDLVTQAGVGFCLGHNRRCAPAIKDARRITLQHRAHPVNPAWRFDREGLGGPDNDWDKRTLVLIRVNDDALSWKAWAFEEGTLFVEMTHFVDLACYLTGLRPAAVTVLGDASTNYSVSSINIEFEDRSLATISTTVNGTFGYPKELIEIYHGGAAIVVDHCVELRVAGVAGEPFWRTYPLDDDDYPQLHTDGGIGDFYRKTLALHQDVVLGKKATCPPPSPNKGHYEMLDEFVAAAMDGKEGPSGIRDAAIATAVILKVAESAANGGARAEVDLSFVK